MKIFVSGSLAYDRIMDFPGKFADHILPDKIHILNVCFMINGLAEKFGGTAGNIAYNLALLEEKALILAAVGKDFDTYENWLSKHSLPMTGIRRIDSEFTAGAYITTDQADNQITCFNPGAMKYPSLYNFADENPADTIAIVSPGNFDDMLGFSRFYKEHKIPCIFDPGQQIPVLSKDQMLEMISGAKILIVNDYELQMIEKATDRTRGELLELTKTLIVTLGEKGSLVCQGDQEIPIAATRARQVVDPTGAGDAYRAGLIKGLLAQKDLTVAAQMGATAASFNVECYGTQEHHFTMAEFLDRYQENFTVTLKL
ncbi:MAG: carbohydrate kinase [Deltaproteobacteria bacterium RIFOXYD12_FULL_57_12]|nr:MAG: carbohydrate kinase [Deltaproteobacteria bacterium RIFOXYD12_FULL_57_12]